MEEEKEFSLSETAQKEMLCLARKALEIAVAENEKSPFTPIHRLISAAKDNLLKNYNPPDEKLKERWGIFVTLETVKSPQEEELRGCIGTFEPREPLYELAISYAIHSGFGDPRFERLNAKELPKIKIKISVLSPLRRVKSPEEVIVGKHGIEIVRGFNSGCFLPEVATEYKMSREEFLSTCCSHKAGLPPDAWKDPKTEIYVFETFKFEEK
jgi:AmmeMemoRadiSam system protein A